MRILFAVVVLGCVLPAANVHGQFTSPGNVITSLNSSGNPVLLAVKQIIPPAIEGEGEGEGTAKGEGDTEGAAAEGSQEEGQSEGITEGEGEGMNEGEGEGLTEKEGEGEASATVTLQIATTESCWSSEKVGVRIDILPGSALMGYLIFNVDYDTACFSFFKAYPGASIGVSGKTLDSVEVDDSVALIILDSSKTSQPLAPGELLYITFDLSQEASCWDHAEGFPVLGGDYRMAQDPNGLPLEIKILPGVVSLSVEGECEGIQEGQPGTCFGYWEAEQNPCFDPVLCTECPWCEYCYPPECFEYVGREYMACDDPGLCETCYMWCVDCGGEGDTCSGYWEAEQNLCFDPILCTECPWCEYCRPPECLEFVGREMETCFIPEICLLCNMCADCPGELLVYSTADTNEDWVISISELLRVIQFFNSDGFHCASGTEDGYAPGYGDMSCYSHGSDYNPQDWHIGVSELLRLIQFYNSYGYHTCIDSEDGFCPGP